MLHLPRGSRAWRAEDEGRSWTIVDRKANPPRLTEEVVRDEDVQANYLTETLDILAEEEAGGAFWFTFAGYEYPYNPDPLYDLDCASYGVVKIVDEAAGPTDVTGTMETGTNRAYLGLHWTPKRAFYALAEHYARMQ